MSANNILANSDSIIYRPGGVAGGLVVTSWAQIQKFITARQGNVIVYIDDSATGGAGAHVPAASGITDFQGRAWLMPYQPDAETSPWLFIDDGATLKNLVGVSGTIQLWLESKSAVPSLDFDYDAGNRYPVFYVDKNATIGNQAATHPGCVVPAGSALDVVFGLKAGTSVGTAQPLFHTVAGSFVNAFCSDDCAMVSGTGTLVPNTWLDGLGTATIYYSGSTVNTSFGIPQASASTSTSYNVDSQRVTMTVLATTANVLAPFQAAGLVIPRLPKVGNIPITVEGFGGTGGGGGGAGGATGGGGGGSGGCQYSSATILFNLADHLNVVIGAGGAAGAAGIAAGGAGGAGGDGTASYVLDATSTVVLAAFSGSSGGGGGTAAAGGRPGASLAGPTAIPGQYLTTNTGFASAGGAGGAGVTAGSAGNEGYVALGTTAGAPLWSGGAGGASGAGDGGGGGGGGMGPFATGGAGGAGNAGVGNPGLAPAANTGAGSGGGAGGAGAGNAGSAGAAGTTGWIRLTFDAPA